MNLFAAFGRFKGWNLINIVAYCANFVWQLLERSQNAALLGSPARAHTTTPARSILEPPEIRIPPYYGHTAVVQFVSNLEGLHALILITLTYKTVSEL